VTIPYLECLGWHGTIKMQCFRPLPVIIWLECDTHSMSNTPQQDSSLPSSSSVSGSRVDFTFHLFCGLHIFYVFWSKHMPVVTECSSLFPSITQWFLPCQLLRNLSTDTSGAELGICLYHENMKKRRFYGWTNAVLITIELLHGLSAGAPISGDWIISWGIATAGRAWVGASHQP
jgi:hypothetical protein